MAKTHALAAQVRALALSSVDPRPRQTPRFGERAIPLEIQHDGFTVVILENRILPTACERTLLVPGVDAESARMLRRLLRDFAGVTPLTQAPRRGQRSAPPGGKTHVVLRRDIVWNLRGTPVAVIDAKYKADSLAEYPNAELYQIAAYCTVLGLHSGQIV